MNSVWGWRRDWFRKSLIYFLFICFSSVTALLWVYHILSWCSRSFSFYCLCFRLFLLALSLRCSHHVMVMRALPCCNSKKALSSINPLPLIQRFRRGWHKVVIAARGMVFNVMKTPVMWSALTSVTVLFMVLSIPVAASSSLFTFKSLISPSTTSVTLKSLLE